MSRIDELIADLCPAGVPFYELQSMFDTRNGYTPSKSDPTMWADGTVPWFRMEDLRDNGGVLGSAIQSIPERAVKGGRLFPANSILVATSATIGEHALITVPHLSNQRFTSLALKPEFAHAMDMKFVYYYAFVLDEWCLGHTSTSSFASVDMAGFKRFKFPVPPLEVQREIVRILDQFSQLEAELEAELEARTRQYRHYRDRLVAGSVSDGVRHLPLGEVARFRRGTAFTVKQARGGQYPVVANGPKPIAQHDEFNREGAFLVIARSGAYAGTVTFWSGKHFLTDAFSIHPDPASLHTRYAYHLLQRMQQELYSMKAGGGVPHVRVREVEAYVAPIPPLSEQIRIAEILDGFDMLVNDLSVGLPAELAARRKQYEYYRDKLLTFEEVS